MKTSKSGIDLIKKYEGCRLKAYLCPSLLVTIGFGNTYYPNGKKVTMQDKSLTMNEALDLFKTILVKYENIVKRNITRELNQNQFNALLSFCFNYGSSKTLFDMINKNDPNTSKWWQEHYIRSNGIKLSGLIKRRKEEAELYDRK